MSHADFFLKIDGVDGESHDAYHKGAMDLESWNWGQSQPVSRSSGGSAAGKVQLESFFCTMKHCKASPKLFMANASGEHLKRARLICRKAGGKPHVYWTMTMYDVLVSSICVNGGFGNGIPTDRISLDFARVEWEYFEQKSDGSSGPPVRAGWDRLQNVPI